MKNYLIYAFTILVIMGASLCHASEGRLLGDTTGGARIYIFNNTITAQTFNTTGNGQFTVQPQQGYVLKGPVFNSTMKYSITNTNGDSFTIKWMPYHGKDAPSEGTTCLAVDSIYAMQNYFYYVACPEDNDIVWLKSAHTYNGGESMITTYVYYLWPSTGAIWSIGSNTCGNPGGGDSVWHGDSQATDRQGMIIFYGDAKPLPNPANQTIPNS